MPSELSQAARTAMERAEDPANYPDATSDLEAGFLAARDYGRERERALLGALVTAIQLLDADMFDRSDIEPLRAVAASPGEPEGQPEPDRQGEMLPSATLAVQYGEAKPGSCQPMSSEQRAEYEKRIRDSTKGGGGSKAAEIFVRDTFQPDHGPGEPSETTVFTELVGVDEIKRGDTIWAPDDGDWLLVDTYARIDREAEFRRKDGSIATFDRAKQILRRAVRQVGESNG